MTRSRWRPTHARAATLRTGSSRGFATAETAAALPTLMIVLAVSLWLIQSVSAHLECVDAARAAARAAARGEPLEQVREAAKSATRPEAEISITQSQQQTKVQITLQVRPPWSASFPPMTVTASATAGTER
ncbi:TadE family type IV pilus minor pilin [Nonomuraea typhae]|uniref:TadE family type IV pilus minor pilin n=1 Tax=Nonomuraea typhae TaxID=2603600 RepID=A0ABW7Z2C6_9ACTN